MGVRQRHHEGSNYRSLGYLPIPADVALLPAGITDDTVITIGALPEES